MQMVILCGGLATRLGIIAKEIPKSMIDINGKPFLQHQIELLKKHDFDEIILCIGHLGEQIKNYFGDGTKFGINIKYSKDNQLGVIGAIKNAEPLLRDNFFMMYGDSYLPHLDFNNMYQKYQNQDKLALMSIWKNNNKTDKSNIKIKNGLVTNVGEPNSDYVDYGAIVLNKKILELIPPNKPFSTKEFWKKLTSKKQLGIYEVKKRLYHIGNIDGLKELRKIKT